jgi:hypothetical protein
VACTIATSSICLGRPAFGLSSSPPMPSASYRFRQAITVGFETPTRWTISPVPAPSAAASTILARITSPAGIDGDLSHRSSSARSRGDTSTPVVNAMDDDPTK